MTKTHWIQAALLAAITFACAYEPDLPELDDGYEFPSDLGLFPEAPLFDGVQLERVKTAILAPGKRVQS